MAGAIRSHGQCEPPATPDRFRSPGRGHADLKTLSNLSNALTEGVSRDSARHVFQAEVIDGRCASS